MERPGGKRTPTERSSPNIEWTPLEKPPEQPVAKAVWKRAGDSRRPIAPPPTAEVTWEKFDTPTLAAPPVAPRYERVQKTITFEQMERISTLEEGIQNARPKRDRGSVRG